VCETLTAANIFAGHGGYVERSSGLMISIDDARSRAHVPTVFVFLAGGRAKRRRPAIGVNDHGPEKRRWSKSNETDHQASPLFVTIPGPERKPRSHHQMRKDLAIC
jgi:hypothetical protein